MTVEITTRLDSAILPLRQAVAIGYDVPTTRTPEVLIPHFPDEALISATLTPIQI